MRFTFMSLPAPWWKRWWWRVKSYIVCDMAEGEKYPWWTGHAYYRFDRMCSRAYVIPLNLVVGLWWNYILRFLKNTKWHRIYWDQAYEAGRKYEHEHNESIASQPSECKK